MLFLDELPEFRCSVLEVLRQPLEDAQVTIARAAITLTFPARLMLAAAMNPCPCSFLDDWQHTSAPYLSTIHPKLVKPLLHHQAAPSRTAKENNSGLSKFFATTRHYAPG